MKEELIDLDLDKSKENKSPKKEEMASYFLIVILGWFALTIGLGLYALAPIVMRF